MKSQRVKIDDLQAETMDRLTETGVERIRGGWTAYLLPYIEQDNIYTASTSTSSNTVTRWNFENAWPPKVE